MPTPSGPFRISWIGDSLVQGSQTTGVNGPRKEFFEYCMANRLDVDFMGQKSNGTFAMPRHGGFSGFTIGNLTGEINSDYGPGEPYENVKIGLLLAGTNNMGLGATPFENPGTMNLMATMLTAWANASANSTLIVFSLPPIDPAEGEPADNVDTFNAALPGLVTAAGAAHPSVRYVYADLNAALGPWSTDLFADEVHMNDAGASIWAQLAIIKARQYLPPPTQVLPEIRFPTRGGGGVATPPAHMRRRR